MNVSELKRHKPENPYKYTNVELAERKKALRDMERDYPNLPYQWLEMVYDFNKNVIKIINEGKWETPGKFTM